MIGANSRAREKILHTSGTGAYRYCPYCWAFGIQTASVYCPFTRPDITLVPPRNKFVPPEFTNISFQNPILRNDAEWKKIVDHLEEFLEDEEFIHNTGLKA